MKSTENCGVCGQTLIYGNEATSVGCYYCGKTNRGMCYCPERHYVCDTCHSREALDALREILSKATSTAPGEILEKVMSHPAVPMHGPEHHAIVPAVIITAVKNAGYPVPEDALEKVIERGSKIPGGWCGFYGDCGASVGVGVAVSVITGATPLTGKNRALAIEATSLALQKILDGGPRCCKRVSRKAVETAVEFLDDRLGFTLSRGQMPECIFVPRNHECIREECPYYSAT